MIGRLLQRGPRSHRRQGDLPGLGYRKQYGLRKAVNVAAALKGELSCYARIRRLYSLPGKGIGRW